MNVTPLDPERSRREPTASRHAFVTGGGGFIGHHVVRTLLRNDDWTVRALLYPGESDARLNGVIEALENNGDDTVAARLETVRGDVLDANRMRTLTEGCSHVFHLAAIYQMWTDSPKRMWDINVLGTMNVINAAVANDVDRVVHTSSIVAVGQPEDDVARESSPFDRWSSGNDYIRSKYLSEEIALRMNQHIDVVVVNPAMPIGPGDAGPTDTGQLLLDTLSGDAPPIFFRGSLNLVDVRDVARGHVLAAEKGTPGERYILSGHNIDMASLRDLLADVCNVPARRMLPVPGQLVEWLGAASEAVANRITHEAPQLTRTTVAYLREGLRLDCGKAARQLGYKVRPLAGTLREAKAYFEREGMI